MEALFEGGIDGDFEAGGYLDLARQQANHTMNLGWFAEAARRNAVDQRLAHDEHVACARGDAVVLRLDPAEGVKPAFKVVECTKVVVSGRFVGADLFLDAAEPFACGIGLRAASVQLLFSFDHGGPAVREAPPVANEVGDHGPALGARLGLFVVEIAEAARGADRFGFHGGRAAVIGFRAVSQLLDAASDGRVVALSDV